MDVNLLQTLGQIAGVGGLSVGVALLVFRDVIRKNIFPKFKDEQLAYRLLRLIVVLSWTIAVLGMGAWLSINIIEARTPDSISISNAEFSGNLEVASLEFIVNQYIEMTGEPLADEEILDRLERASNLIKGGRYEAALPLFEEVAGDVDIPAVHNNLGVLYAVNRRFDEAEAAYEKAIERDPESQAVQLNLGMLEERRGDTDAASRHLGRADDLEAARAAERRIRERRQAGTIEAEPNDDLYQPNGIPLDEWIDGSIRDGSDSDFFEITTPAIHRDWITIEVENQSTTLRPAITVFYANKQQINYVVGDTPGQDVAYTLVSGPTSKYGIQVWNRGGTHGAYQIKVRPQRAYDAYEPNDDILTAVPLAIGRPLEASIMDGGDNDFYEIETSSTGQTVLVSVQNLSTTLRPAITAYYPNKQQINYVVGDTPGQDTEYAFPKEAHSTYYVQIWNRGGTAGAYRITVVEQQ